jgi:hypothetical protein
MISLCTLLFLVYVLFEIRLINSYAHIKVLNNLMIKDGLFFFLFDTGSCCVVQVGLSVHCVSQGDLQLHPPASSSQVLGLQLCILHQNGFLLLVWFLPGRSIGFLE